MLNRKPYENLFVHDENGRNVTAPQEIYNVVANHFKNHFFDQNEPTIKPFVNEPSPLNNPITIEEVKKCSKAMNNNRAPGFDMIVCEYIKYGPLSLHQAITKVLNQWFEKMRKFE